METVSRRTTAATGKVVRVAPLFLALALSGIAVGAVDKSHSAANRPQAHASSVQAKTEPDRRATSDQPAVVDLVRTPVIRVEASDITPKHHNYLSSEWWLVYLTAALAVFTLGLVIYTARLYRSSVQVGKDAAKTAREAMEFNEASIRPVIVPKIHDASALYPAKGSNTFPQGGPKLTFTWENYGQSAAFLLKADLILRPHRDLPAEPDWSGATLRTDNNIIAPSSYKDDARTPIPITPVAGTLDETKIQQLNMKIDQGLRFFFYGRVVYEDTLGNTLVSGFAFKVFRDGSRHMRGGPRYNYRRPATEVDMPVEAETLVFAPSG